MAKNALKRLIACKRANALVMVAATTPLLIGAGAIGLDTIQLTVAKRNLQRVADSASIAGAYSVLTNDTAAAGVDRDLTLNNNITLSSPRVVENAPTTGPYAGNTRAVRVVLTASRSVPFMSFFTGDEMTISVEATASAMPNGVYCVVSLESGATTGVTFAGSSDTNLGCGVATNATGSSAILVNGNPRIVATPVAARGSLPAASKFQGTTVLIPNSPAQPDPFAHIADPAIPTTPCQSVTVNPNRSRTLDPGCYRALDLKGRVTLNPGTYYIDGGTLSFGSQADVTGDGVTFVLTSSNATSNPSSVATISMNGGASVKLTAPTTGDYANIVFYQDRRATTQNIMINGGSGSVLDGSIYFPKADVTYNGNTGMLVKCLRLVALRVTFSGNSATTNTCPADSPQRGFSGLTVQLVG